MPQPLPAKTRFNQRHLLKNNYLLYALITSLGLILAGCNQQDDSSNQDPSSDTEIISIQAGDNNSCALWSGGEVQCWGAVIQGQLSVQDIGDQSGEMGDALIQVDLGSHATVKDLKSGREHTCALFNNGTVKCWGSNSNGQLGRGHTAIIGDETNDMGLNLPAIDFGSGRSATAITAGSEHTCALLDDGTVKCWGMNGWLQLGQGHSRNIGDDPNEMGDSLPAVNLGNGRTARAIAAGLFHTCALLDNGSVKCWGANHSGELGQGHNSYIGISSDELGDNLPAIDLGSGHTALAIAAGVSYTCALLNNGSVKCWGSNYSGQLGQGHTEHLGNEPNEMGNSLLPVDLGSGHSATAIITAHSHTCALLNTGALKCWGENWFGALGQGHSQNLGDEPNEMGENLPTIDLGSNNTVQAVTANMNNTCAILNTGATKCWGSNWSGKLGQGHSQALGNEADEMGDELLAIDLGSGHTARVIASGSYHSCVLRDDKSIVCWGGNDSGQLGIGRGYQPGDEPGEMGSALSPLLLGKKVTRLATGYSRSCAMYDDGKFKCWGINSHGQLGQGHGNNIGHDSDEFTDIDIDLGSGQSVTAVAIGMYHTCALLDNGTVKCWGSNHNGQLGQGHSNYVGRSSDELGDNLPTVDLGSERTAKEITSGRDHTCALLDNGTVKCWGYNSFGQLGQEHAEDLGDDANEMGDNLLPVDLGRGRIAMAIATGSRHTCAVLDTGTVKCWGYNSDGQLGQGHQEYIGDEPNEMGDNLSAIDLGTGRLANNISLGDEHSCALLDNGTTKCWGANYLNGYKIYRTYGDAPNEMGDNLPTVELGSSRSVIELTSGHEHNCALLDDHSVKCWGRNNKGQLGQGHTKNLSNGIYMGDNLPVVDLRL